MIEIIGNKGPGYRNERDILLILSYQISSAVLKDETIMDTTLFSVIVGFLP